MTNAATVFDDSALLLFPLWSALGACHFYKFAFDRRFSFRDSVLRGGQPHNRLCNLFKR